MEKVMKLQPGREKSLKRRHLWVFSGAVAEVRGEPGNGDTVAVVDSKGNFLAWAAYSPESQLVGRIWSFDSKEKIDAKFFRNRIEAAKRCRELSGLNGKEEGSRVVHSEGDLLPGLIVDRYGEFLVCQFLSAGAERFKQEIIEALQEVWQPKGMYERSDASVRGKEGLPERSGLLTGEEPPNPMIIRENNVRFAVDLRHGQKTGFYFDQRDARKLLASFASGKRILNTFAYTGGFGVAAACAGAEFVVNVDSSASALKLARHNMEMNRISPDRYENREADVFAELRKMTEAGETFDMIVLDPPKFIDSQRNLTPGCRAYQDIARLAFGLLKSGGLLFNFSCSGLMTPELFQKITADAALEAGKTGRILHRFEQAADHPVQLSVPEGYYLKGLMVMVD